MDNQNVPTEKILSVLSYCKDSGRFFWLKSRGGNAPKGSEAGWVRDDRYREIMIEGRRFRAHRLAWLFVHGRFPDGEVDHINGDPGDNRICNLREVTGSENKQSIFRPRSDNKNGFRGVHFNRGKFVAQIRHQGRPVHLGRFEKAEQASAAYLEAKERLHPASRISKPHLLGGESFQTSRE